MKHKSGAVLERKEFAFKAGDVTEDGRFAGYGSVFGNVDGGGDVVQKGAFAASIKRIKESGDPLPALWSHSSRDPIGGFDVLEEDDHGLKCEGFLLKDEVARASEIYALMKRRVVKGLSIGYYVLKDSWNEKTGVRTLIELELVEISPVTFPMNEEATVDSVKSMGRTLKSGALPTLPEFESFLCEAGFSNTQAKAIAGNGLRKLLDRREADGETSDTLKILSDFSLQ
jgi:HK97 family phage prohead protease